MLTSVYTGMVMGVVDEILGDEVGTGTELGRGRKLRGRGANIENTNGNATNRLGSEINLKYSRKGDAVKMKTFDTS